MADPHPCNTNTKVSSYIHFDALQLMFGFPCFSIADSPWPTERRGIVPTSICICVLVCRYLPFYVCICLNIIEYRKKFLIEKDEQRGALSSFKSGRVLAAAARSRWVAFPLPPPTTNFNLKLIEGAPTGHFDFLQEFLRISCIWMNAFVYCRFSSNWILLYFPTVRPCVRHRRDISHFSHI